MTFPHLSGYIYDDERNVEIQEAVNACSQKFHEITYREARFVKEYDTKLKEDSLWDLNVQVSESKNAEIDEKESFELTSFWKGHRDNDANKKKRGRFDKVLTEPLLEWLLKHLHNPYPSQIEKEALAFSTGLDVNQIQNWFLNMRKRHLTKKRDKNPRSFFDFVVRSNDAPDLPYSSVQCNPLPTPPPKRALYSTGLQNSAKNKRQNAHNNSLDPSFPTNLNQLQQNPLHYSIAPQDVLLPGDKSTDRNHQFVTYCEPEDGAVSIKGFPPTQTNTAMNESIVIDQNAPLLLQEHWQAQFSHLFCLNSVDANFDTSFLLNDEPTNRELEELVEVLLSGNKDQDSVHVPDDVHVHWI